MARKMSRIGFDREKLLKERLTLIKERHEKVILEPRRKNLQNIEPDFFFDDDDDAGYLDQYDGIRVESEEAENELF